MYKTHSQLIFFLMSQAYIFTRLVPIPGGLGMRLISPTVARVTHRLCKHYRMVDRGLLVQPEVAEGMVQDLLLVDKVGD